MVDNKKSHSPKAENIDVAQNGENSFNVVSESVTTHHLLSDEAQSPAVESNNVEEKIANSFMIVPKEGTRKLVSAQTIASEKYNVDKNGSTSILNAYNGNILRCSSDKISQYQCLSSKYTLIHKWRRGVQDILKRSMFDEDGAHKCLDYLEEMFKNAICTVKHGLSQEIKKPLTVPNNLVYKDWISIIQGIGLLKDQEALDAQNDIHRTAVFLPNNPNLETFQEFINLLKLIKGCNWTVLQTLLESSEERCLALLQLLEHCIENKNLKETDRKRANTLYDEDIFLMKQIGFTRSSLTEPLTWFMSKNAVNVASIIKGLFGHLKRPESNVL